MCCVWGGCDSGWGGCKAQYWVVDLQPRQLGERGRIFVGGFTDQAKRGWSSESPAPWKF